MSAQIHRPRLEKSREQREFGHDIRTCFPMVSLSKAEAQMNDKSTKGDAMRRKVLGNAHVDSAAAAATPLDGAFQQLITEGA